jgi:hypothetical protein
LRHRSGRRLRGHSAYYSPPMYFKVAPSATRCNASIDESQANSGLEQVVLAEWRNRG